MTKNTIDDAIAEARFVEDAATFGLAWGVLEGRGTAAEAEKYLGRDARLFQCWGDHGFYLLAVINRHASIDYYHDRYASGLWTLWALERTADAEELVMERVASRHNWRS